MGKTFKQMSLSPKFFPTPKKTRNKASTFAEGQLPASELKKTFFCLKLAYLVQSQVNKILALIPVLSGQRFFFSAASVGQCWDSGWINYTALYRCPS